MKQEVIKAYTWIRQNNQTIPDEVLDLMYYSALEKLEQVDKYINEKEKQRKKV